MYKCTFWLSGFSHVVFWSSSNILMHRAIGTFRIKESEGLQHMMQLNTESWNYMLITGRKTVWTRILYIHFLFSMLTNTMLTGYQARSSNRNNYQIKRHCLSIQDDLEACQDLLCLSPQCIKLHVNKSRRLAALPVFVIVFPSLFAICSNAFAETCTVY